MAKTAQQATYVDGFLLTVHKDKLAAYKKMAKEAGKIWRKHGALDYKECMINDATPKGVTFTFEKAAKAKPGEIVFFSYIVFASKKHRNEVNAKVMKDPFMNDSKYKDMPMPFDMKRMAYGGFKVAVDA